MSRELLLLGNPALREISRHVRNPGSSEARKLAQDVFAALRPMSGVALSAPQIGVQERLFVMPVVAQMRQAVADARADQGPAFPDKWSPGLGIKPLQYMAVINPVVVDVSDEVEADHEACLSVPGLIALVPRHCEILVDFRTMDNKRHRLELEGLAARCFQHELDHLDGIMITDRIMYPGDLIMEKELLRQEAAEDSSDYEDSETSKRSFERYFIVD